MWKDLNLLSHFVLFSFHLTSILRLRVGWGSRVGQSRSGKPGGGGNPPSTSALREASRCCRCRLSEPREAQGARGGTHGKGPGSQRGLVVPPLTPVRGTASERRDTGKGSRLTERPRTLTAGGRPSAPPGARRARGGTHGKCPRGRGHFLSDCRPLSQGLNSERSE